ncbi:hypothetical protein HNY73_016388 [Argiope bruennichi]|uniref:EGF-like domain-containing protein n=1 Tax=Argiope bruennichi TaxID=94029 RepID=A0A8T0EM41_ARGBR|nr:hypothetical protein HNY73_016388 [Argiope bruennichi]
MWIVTAISCLILFIRTLSNPLISDRKMESSDALDDFYRQLQSTFDKFLEPGTTSNDDLPMIENENFEMESNKPEETESKEMEKKLKRDDSAAESHMRFDMNNANREMGLIGFSPLYPCDSYDAVSRTCINTRQIGTTLTLGVRVGSKEKQKRHRIRWFRCYKRRGALSDIKKEFTKDNVPWNINIGGESNELRISPVTEIDFSYNYFLVVFDMTQLRQRKPQNQEFIKFYVEPINIDMGALYPGEELVIYARAFMELPMRSMNLEWSLSDTNFPTRYDLPSNMKINADGSSVVVKELRGTMDRVLTCSVYSNKNVFLAKRNFLFRKIDPYKRSKASLVFPTYDFKTRKKRNIDENEGFQDDEDEVFQRHNSQFSDVHNKQSNEDKMSEFYDNEQFHNYGNRPRRYKSAFQTKFSDPSAEYFPLNDALFYNGNGKTQPYLGKYHQNDKKVQSYSGANIAEPHFVNTVRQVPQKTAFNRNFQQEFRIPNQPAEATDESLNNKIKFNFLGKPQFNKRQIDQPFLGNREHPFQLHNINQQVNFKEDEDIQLENLQRVHSTSDGKFTFDDSESLIIADCKDNFDCNIHANCHRSENGINFCKCNAQYNGNGIFCWLI